MVGVSCHAMQLYPKISNQVIADSLLFEARRAYSAASFHRGFPCLINPSQKNQRSQITRSFCVSCILLSIGNNYLLNRPLVQLGALMLVLPGAFSTCIVITTLSPGGRENDQCLDYVVLCFPSSHSANCSHSHQAEQLAKRLPHFKSSC